MVELVPLPDGLDAVRRIGVVADTHIPDRARTLHPDLLPGLKNAHVDLIIHAGDVCVPSVLIELSQIAPVIGIRGNRDWALAGQYPWVRRITIGKLRIAIEHGMGDFWHYWVDKVKFATVGYQFDRYKKLMLASTPDFNVYIFGHTHRAENRREDDVLFFNPGSASFTPPSYPGPSFGILQIDGRGDIIGEIIPIRRLNVEAGNWVETK